MKKSFLVLLSSVGLLLTSSNVVASEEEAVAVAAEEVQPPSENFEAWSKLPYYNWKKGEEGWEKTDVLADEQEPHKSKHSPLSKIKPSDIKQVAALEIFKKAKKRGMQRRKEAFNKAQAQDQNQIDEWHQEQTELYAKQGSWFSSWHY